MPPKTVHPLTDAHAKLAWANVHINRLRHEIIDGGHSEMRPVTVADGSPDYEQSLERSLQEAIPSDLAFITADAIHNMRTALDHLMHQLTRLSGKEAYPTFPICNSEKSLQAHTSLKRLTDSAKAFVLSRRPYKGGCDLLWWLHRIDIIDKHRRLNLIEHAPPTALCVDDDKSPSGKVFYMVANYWLEEDSTAPREVVQDVLARMHRCVTEVLDAADVEFFPGDPAVSSCRSIS